MIPKVRTSAVIQAPPEAVWAIVRDFNGLSGWHPTVVESVIEDGGGGAQVGCVRRYGRKDGSLIRERLIALDDLELSQTYMLLDAPLPVRNYVATLRLRPITESGWTFAEWLAWYDCAPADEARLREAIHEVFRSGLDTLGQRLR